MSLRFDLPEGQIGVLGAHSTRPDAFGWVEADEFTSFVALVGLALSQLRERDLLRHDARFDPLTGVLNRGASLASLADRLCLGGDVCALLIDLDGFKSVNDDHGHAVGDIVLNELARRMERCLDPNDTLGRLGGDEFLVVISDRSRAASLAERIVGSVEEVILVDRSLVQLSASVGVAIRLAGDDVASMIERADRLMYKAKSAGRGQTRLDVDTAVSHGDTVPTRRSTRSTPAVQRPAVDEAIAGLRMMYQPIVEADTGHVYGYEALTRGPVGHQLEFPSLLFSEATTHGRLGELELAAKTLALAESPNDAVPLFVNLEPELLCDEKWGPRLIDVIVRGAAGRPIVAEVTERAVLQSPGRLLRAVEACRERGWRVALDDVGSRSDSLAVLRCVRPDVVKLDMGLIEIGRSAHAAHVAAAVSAYRESHPALVVAEGVEDREQLEQAKVLGADLIQGYLFGRPSPRGSWASSSVARSGVDRVDACPPSVRVGSKRNLLHLSRHVESAVLTPDCMLLASVQHVDNFTEGTRRQYSAIARRCGMVGVVGEGMTERYGNSVNGVRVADLAVGDALANHWNVVVLSPSKSLALLAEEIEPVSDEWGTSSTAETDRRFAFRLLTDGDTVEAAAGAILRHF
jgi:diguanylate cyclase (GGDEF)-like protein